jgi:asparagine synthase (glutamine-hydrolysing)
MCGICGIMVPPGAVLPDASVAATARGFLDSRGPDDRGEYRGDGIWFGHTRLSVIDLAGGHQPMAADGDRVVVVFNGEIWNFHDLRQELAARGYEFATRCDTEVLLHGYREWGAGLPERLDGMFAFAIWDAPAGELLLARDRMGEKPLFLAERNGALAFASDCRSAMALAGLRPEVDQEALPEFLLQRYVAAPRTLFKGVRKLPPGHLVLRSNHGETVRPYWSLDPSEGSLDNGPLTASGLREILERSVERRLMSDVPVGVFLSGGLDSAAVLAMAHQPAGSLASFTIGFRDPRYDERPRARAAAEHFGTDHHEVEVVAEDFVDAVPRLAWHRDEPIAEPSEVPLLLLAESASGIVKVVLTGDAGDEVFGGYPKYRAERFLRRTGPLGRAALAVAGSAAALSGSHRQLDRAIETARMKDRTLRWMSWFRSFDAGEIGDLLASDPNAVGDHLMAEARSALAPYSDVDPDRQLLTLDLLRWLPDNMLARSDKVLMAASLEGRAPLVDRELIRAVSSSWARSSMANVRSKTALRDAVADSLPPSSLHGPKRGFTVPVAEFINMGPDRPLERIVLSERSLSRGLLDPDAIRRVAGEAEAGSNRPLKLFTLASLELWLRCHVDEVLARPPSELSQLTD